MARPSYHTRVLAVLAAMVAAALLAAIVWHAPASAATATDTLKKPPFAPTDVGLLETAAYPEGPPMVPASSARRTKRRSGRT